MLQNYNVDITEFVKITNAGVFTADYAQIRASLIQRYKDIYGTDIDLSTGSADGTWIAQQALIINNICQVIKNLYSNLDINTASGIYLDSLCALSNVKRKQATKSTAKIKITNLLNVERTLQNLQFLDKSGVIWNYNKEITIAANASVAITVECSQYGEIEAPEGWIYQTFEVENLAVEQLASASIGTNQETDSELKARRNESTTSNGVTVLESLVAALLEISGIEDVKIYNNSTSSDEHSNEGDETTIPPHTIYVIVRKKEGVEVIDEDIGTMIYLKLTPGIRTVAPDESLPAICKKSYQYFPYINERKIEGFNQMIYWKQAYALNPQIDVVISPYEYFSVEEIPDIASSAITYLNSLRLSEDIDENSLKTELIYADPLFRGRSTYSLVSVGSNVADYTENDDNYFYYTKYFVKSNGTISNGTNSYILTNGQTTLGSSTSTFTLYNNCITEVSNSDPTTTINTYPVMNNQFSIGSTNYLIQFDAENPISKDTSNYTISLS